MTKRKLSISLEDLNDILDGLQSIVDKVTKIIPKFLEVSKGARHLTAV